MLGLDTQWRSVASCVPIAVTHATSERRDLRAEELVCFPVPEGTVHHGGDRVGPWWQKELAKGASQVMPTRKQRLQAESKAGTQQHTSSN